MTKLSNLRRGRRLITGAKRIRLRRRQPRYAGLKLRSGFRAAPRRPGPEKPYLPSSLKPGDLLG